MHDPIDTFREEAKDNLDALEQALLELEEQPEDSELLASSFRSMHTIKGASGMFGFDGLSRFTHHLENVLDSIRSGDYSLSSELIGIILDAKDHIADLLEDPELTNAQKIRSDTILEALFNAIPTDNNDKTTTGYSSEQIEEKDDTNKLEKLWRIKLQPNPDSFKDGFDLGPIVRELESYGTIKVITYQDTLPLIDELSPQTCYLNLEIFLTSHNSESEIMDTFIFVDDDWTISLDEIDPDDYESGQIGEILANRGDASKKDIDDALSARGKAGEILTKAGLVSDEKVKAALDEQQIVRESKKKQQNDATVKVPVKKLNSLMDLVGELVIVQARMNQVSKDYDDELLLGISEELDRLSTGLRDNTFEIRMLPIGTSFSRFRRLVRDLSKELDKQIKLITQGADTELDKMVIDRLSDPLVHLIRNSIDHGIEPPKTRKEKNKDPQGSIFLSAEHQESSVVLTIKDDGAGLDVDKIKARAIEKNIIKPDEKLSDEEVYNLIFAPGFSTASSVTDISGRGVGMDVVKSSIETLRGEVTVDSQVDLGTTITIRLPMTLAIIEGLMVAVSHEKYVIPLNHVEECIELDKQNLNASSSWGNELSNLIRVRDQQIPFVRLRDWFGVGGETPSIEQVVLIKLKGELFGLCIDDVIGQHQTVIKSLGKYIKGNTGISGATILGDGSVAMILDINKLVQDIQSSSQESESSSVAVKSS